MRSRSPGIIQFAPDEGPFCTTTCPFEGYFGPISCPTPGNDPFSRTRGIIEQDLSVGCEAIKKAFRSASDKGMDRPRRSVDDYEVDPIGYVVEAIPSSGPVIYFARKRRPTQISFRPFVFNPACRRFDEVFVLVETDKSPTPVPGQCLGAYKCRGPSAKFDHNLRAKLFNRIDDPMKETRVRLPTAEIGERVFIQSDARE